MIVKHRKQRERVLTSVLGGNNVAHLLRTDNMSEYIINDAIATSGNLYLLSIDINPSVSILYAGFESSRCASFKADGVEYIANKGLFKSSKRSLDIYLPNFKVFMANGATYQYNIGAIGGNGNVWLPKAWNHITHISTSYTSSYGIVDKSGDTNIFITNTKKEFSDSISQEVSAKYIAYSTGLLTDFQHSLKYYPKNLTQAFRKFSLPHFEPLTELGTDGYRLIDNIAGGYFRPTVNTNSVRFTKPGSSITLSCYDTPNDLPGGKPNGTRYFVLSEWRYYKVIEQSWEPDPAPPYYVYPISTKLNTQNYYNIYLDYVNKILYKYNEGTWEVLSTDIEVQPSTITTNFYIIFTPSATYNQYYDIRYATLYGAGIPSEVYFDKTPIWIVSFDLQFDDSICPTVSEDGAIITEPETPTREGYNFLGWYPLEWEEDATFPITPDPNPTVGMKYYDTTLGKVLTYGLQWDEGILCPKSSYSPANVGDVYINFSDINYVYKYTYNGSTWVNAGSYINSFPVQIPTEGKQIYATTDNPLYAKLRTYGYCWADSYIAANITTLPRFLDDFYYDSVNDKMYKAVISDTPVDISTQTYDNHTTLYAKWEEIV